MFRQLLVALFLVCTAAQPSYYDAGKSACVPGSGFDKFRFCNASLSVDQRVADLVSRISDEQKPNLLTARGHLTNRGREALPKLGVPSYYWGANAIHSSMFANCTDAGRCSTSFPSGPSWAATFDRSIMQDMAIVVGEEIRAAWNMGNWTDNGNNGLGLDAWGPVINMNRDPRWGRNGEGGAECPYLMGELGSAWTRGLQEGRGEEKRFVQVAVTLKHFDANSLEGGSAGAHGLNRHTVDVNLTKYLLADYYWPAFKGTVQ
jgi:beta-glucosidase